MQVYIVGRGRLAHELIHGLAGDSRFDLSPWPGAEQATSPTVVVHAGSGRELPAVAAWCERNATVLVELATGSVLQGQAPPFPVVLCPNTNLLMLQVMRWLALGGPMLRGRRIRMLESHQASKTTVPGTAVALAASLGLAPADIASVRDPVVQRTALDIPDQHLGRHALHRIVIEDGNCSVHLETRVLGSAPYVEGVRRILAGLQGRVLEPRVHAIDELLDAGWLEPDTAA